MATQKNKISQQWHIVCGSMEIEELGQRGYIKSWHAKNDRHSLFMMIKHPNTEFYKGGWGSELLHFSDDGPHRGSVGKIFCTYERYKEITNWFLTNMFKP